MTHRLKIIIIYFTNVSQNLDYLQNLIYATIIGGEHAGLIATESTAKMTGALQEAQGQIKVGDDRPFL